MPVYKTDKELDSLAKQIIDDHRQRLRAVKIAYMFREEAAISEGKLIVGMTIRVDDRNRIVHGYDFLVELAQDVWLQASNQFRVALMDHELGHVGIRLDADGEPEIDERMARVKTYVARHDIEEFEDVRERHGAYYKELRSFLEAFARHKREKKPAPED